jgi:hypothetical protein
LAAIWSKVNQTKKQVMGLPYESVTPSGAKCTCPATQTPARILTDIASSKLTVAKDDLKKAADQVKQVYDQVGTMKDDVIKKVASTRPCEVGDKVINNRNRIYFGLLLAVMIFFISISVYSKAYGTPDWWAAITNPTWRFVTGLNLRPVFQGKFGDYSIYFIIALFFLITGYGLYQVRGNTS